MIIIKFPYNAHSDWLKQRALSENKARVDDGKLAFEFGILTNLTQIYTVDSRRQNTLRNKQILNLNSASIKDIIFATKAEITLKK